MDLDLNVGLDPHVETSREELELALKGVQDRGYKVEESTFTGTGNSKFLSAGPNASIHASFTSATDLQQADVGLAVDRPGSHPDKMPWPQISVYSASHKGICGEDDLLTTIKSTSDEVHHEETGIFRQPPSVVSTSYSILPLERLSGIFKYKHKVVKDSSPKINRRENDAPICKLTQDEKHHEEVMAIATKPGSGSRDTFIQKQIPETLSVEFPEAILKPFPEPPSVDKEYSIGKGCAEVEYSGPTEATLRLQVESHGPNSGASALPTTFSGLFQSILASENPSSQLVETASLQNGLLATSSTVSAVNIQAVKDIANTTTTLMLDSLNQPHRRLESPGFLRVENAIESSNRMKPNTVVPALGSRSESLPIRSAFREASYREARAASAATTVSAAAAAAKSAVQAAEASIEALAQLGINNGSLYQGRNSYLNPQPLQVASESRPAAAGVKRTFPDQRPPIVEQNGGKSMMGTLDLIKIGSTVEVMPEEDGLQGGWFIAKVLTMTPKEALVVYDDLMTDDGCSHLEESFPLHSSREEDTFGTTVPGALGWIRPVHPYSSSQKRGHFTMVHVNWVVGDHVDAFVDEGWWEGIIEDLNEADETRITVLFPGDSNTMVVRSWNVRPSLIWKKGEWRPCRGDSVEQDGPPSKRQKRSTAKGEVERERTKTKVAAARNPVQEHKKTPEPLAKASTKQSRGASKSDNKGMVLYSKNTGTGQVVVTPGRELRSRTRSNASTAQTKVSVNSSKTPVSKKPAANATNSKDIMNGSSPLTRSQQIVAVTPEPSWDVRRLSTRLQEKEASQSPRDAVRGKTPSSRSSKKEVLVSPQDTVRGKTASRRSQHKEAIETPRNSAREQALAIIPLPKEEPRTRARTRAQMLAGKKG